MPDRQRNVLSRRVSLELELLMMECGLLRLGGTALLGCLGQAGKPVLDRLGSLSYFQAVAGRPYIRLRYAGVAYGEPWIGRLAATSAATVDSAFSTSRNALSIAIPPCPGSRTSHWNCGCSRWN